MTALDLIVFLACMFAVPLLGIAAARRRRTREDFLVAGRSLGWLPVGASIMASLFSAVNFTAYSGEVMTNGLYVLLVLPAFLVVAFPVIRWVIPFHFNSGSVSAYEYFERRFDSRVRLLASALFILWRIAWMAVVLYAPCVFLAPVLKVDYRLLVLAGGLATTVHGAYGGMRSVIWAHVVQVAVIFVSIAAGVVFALKGIGSLDAILAAAPASGQLRPFFPVDGTVLSLDPRVRISVWSCLVGGTTAFLARYGADQMVVQRYVSARSLGAARAGFAVNIVLAVSVLVLLSFLGVLAQAYCESMNALGPSAVKPAARLAEFFALLPSGLLGLLAAGMAASSVSSIDSGIHTCCSAITADFARRDRTVPAGRNGSLGFERVVVFAIGAVVMVLALFVGRLGSLFEIANRIINGLGSPLLALFLVAALSRRVTARGMFWGGAAGLVWSIVISTAIENLALHYYAVVNLGGTMVFCLVFSWILAQKSEPAPRGPQPGHSRIHPDGPGQKVER